VAGRVIPLRVGGVELLVEASPVAGSESTSTRLDRAQDAVAEAWDRAQSAIVEVAASTVSTLGQLGRHSVRPDEVKVKFGLKFSAQGRVSGSGPRQCRRPDRHLLPGDPGCVGDRLACAR
jgi:hypothetical protein